jgi:HEAT repeat protein
LVSWCINGTPAIIFKQGVDLRVTFLTVCLIFLSCSCELNSESKLEFKVKNIISRIETKGKEHRQTIEDWRELENIGIEAAPVLEQLLKSENPEIRKGIVSLFGKLEYKNGFKAVEKIAQKDKETDVRVWAIHALERINHERALVLLLGLAKDEDPFVRRATISELAKYPTKDICPVLAILIKDRTPIVREEAGTYLILQSCSDSRGIVQEAVNIETNYKVKSGLQLMLDELKNQPEE